MKREAHHSDSSTGETLQVPAQMSARQRLEWEVSQLADGTLPGHRREEVEAALVSDASLREEYAAHRRVHALVRQAPPPEADMAALRADIMAAIGEEARYGTRSHPTEFAGGGGLGLALSRWWVTITAAAASLAVGLSLGTVWFGGAGVDRGGEIAGTGTGAFSQLDVEGPVAILQQAQSSEQQSIALSVSGPDYRLVLDPPTDATAPSYTYMYGTSAVVDTPGRIIIASAGDE